MTCWSVFDLDGTLVDSRAAVEAAYREAGADPPRDFWGRPWREWLDDPNVHTLKCLLYPHALAAWGQPLPALRVLAEAIERGDEVHILTGASLRSTRDALRFLGVRSRHVHLHCEQSWDNKIDWLLTHGPGDYWDDDRDFLLRVWRETQWRTHLAPSSWSQRLEDPNALRRPDTPVPSGL